MTCSPKENALEQAYEINEEQETGAIPIPTQTAEDLATSGLTGFEIAVIKDLGLEDALRGVHEEARNSGLPGLERGPANAYQHLLISGELWRRVGPIVGPPGSLSSAPPMLGRFVVVLHSDGPEISGYRPSELDALTEFSSNAVAPP